RVDYVKNGATRVLWSAGSDRAYCRPRAEAFIHQLEASGFYCIPADGGDPCDDDLGTASAPSGRGMSSSNKDEEDLNQEDAKSLTGHKASVIADVDGQETPVLLPYRIAGNLPVFDALRKRTTTDLRFAHRIDSVIVQLLDAQNRMVSSRPHSVRVVIQN